MIAPEIRELQVFLALVKAGSFSSAALQLGVTQPAVSAQIVKLEQLIGYPLFQRCKEGTAITEQGSALVPFAEEVIREHADLLRRAAYWSRFQTKRVKIWTDGSCTSHEAKILDHELNEGNLGEQWQNLGSETDWADALRIFEVDIVLAASFLTKGDIFGIRTVNILQQQGITIAWSPVFHLFDVEAFNLADAIVGNPILPARSLAIGFREFLGEWCQSQYGLGLDEAIECKTEAEAVNACKRGLGIIVFPGDADQRLNLRQAGLETVHAFKFALPKAFTFGIHYRMDEQNPQILSVVQRISKKLKASI